MTDQSNQDGIWDHYQTERPESFDGSAARLRYLANYVRSKSTVLNIGVGNGLFEQFADERGGIIYSLDPSEASIAKLRDLYRSDSRFRVGYIESIPFPDAQFDVVVVSEVLEHLDERTLDAGLREVARVLRPEGMLVGTVPAREDLKSQSIMCPHCDRLFHRWGHVQSFDHVKIAEILSGRFAGLKVEERPFVTWKSVNWKGKIVAAVKSLLHMLGVHGSNENFVFVCRKSTLAPDAETRVVKK